MKNVLLLTGAETPKGSRVVPTFTSSLVAIAVGQGASGVIALTAEIVYARALGPSARGIISLSFMSIAFATTVGGLGGEGAIVYWASRPSKANSGWLPAVLAWGSVGCAVAAGLWAYLFWRIEPTFLHGMSSSAARVVLTSIPAAIAFSFSMALASGMEEFRIRSLCASFRQLVGLATLFILLFALGRTVQAALWGNVVGLIAAALATTALLSPRLRKLWSFRGVLSEFKPTLTYAVRGQVGNLATFFTYRLDVFIVNYFLNAEQLGFYALGVLISEALWQVPQAVASALFPRTARSIEGDATPFTCMVLRQAFLSTSVGGIAIAVLAPAAIPLVFGLRFKPSIAVVWWLLPGTIALALAKIGCADLAGRGKNGYSSISAILAVSFTALLDWTLIPRMGIIGASLASSLAYSLDAVLILAALCYELQVSWTSLLLPRREDFLAYRSAWMRIRKSISGISGNSLAAGATYSTREGD